MALEQGVCVCRKIERERAGFLTLSLASSKVHNKNKVYGFLHNTVLYLEASVLLKALPNSLNPKDPISVKTL